MFAFGQLPGGIIYREVHEINGPTLEAHICSIKSPNTGPLSTEESRPTDVSEVEAIDLCLKVIALTEKMHE